MTGIPPTHVFSQKSPEAIEKKGVDFLRAQKSRQVYEQEEVRGWTLEIRQKKGPGTRI
jgi:hypothetical protein